jgi:hypothetical protein
MFIQPDWLDPTMAGVGTNRYSDSNNDPIDRIDTNGNFWGLAVKLVKVALKGGDISLTVAGIVQDAKVLMASSALVSDRAIAAASLASEVISPITLRDAKAVKKAVEGKPSVPEGTSSIPTVSRATNRGLPLIIKNLSEANITNSGETELRNVPASQRPQVVRRIADELERGEINW